jgi:hypothetical protein
MQRMNGMRRGRRSLASHRSLLKRLRPVAPRCALRVRFPLRVLCALRGFPHEIPPVKALSGLVKTYQRL